MAMKIRGRRKLNMKFMVFLILAMVMASTVQTFYYIDHNLRPTFMVLAEEKSKQLATDVINKAVIEQIADNTNYDSLIDFKQQSNGRLTAGYFNMQEAVRIQGEVTDNIQKALQSLPQKSLSLPLGIAFNNSILASMGPNIPIQITPIGTVKSNIGWDTREAGINQTVHILYLQVDIQTEVVVQFATKPFDLSTKVPISYLVMMGDVPQMVYNAKGESLASNSGSLPPIQLPNLNTPVGQTNSSK
ncbi:MAG: sporulation protein YunB [Tumebacillaceae bacterium]